ncbi:hypothetical protein GCK32_003318 [Trichostrongylus colubriformis]|uniref:Uncharacterized protein n=1 Tax=Trichostrongylus colubriformis TaxID=6319 RepID=A0AAN8IFF7_TRICO
MTPQPTSKSKTGAKQFDEMYEKLQNANIDLRTLWVQVTSPRDWSSSSGTNVEFLNSIFGRALVSIAVGKPQQASHQFYSRYWSARGCGAVNESPPNFDDFQPFASWTSPSVKQFAKFENICGVMVNR